MEAVGEDTKEEATQEEANNNRSTSEEAQEEAGEGEDTDAAPIGPRESMTRTWRASTHGI